MRRKSKINKILMVIMITQFNGKVSLLQLIELIIQGFEDIFFQPNNPVALLFHLFFFYSNLICVVWGLWLDLHAAFYKQRCLWNKCVREGFLNTCHQNPEKMRYNQKLSWQGFLGKCAPRLWFRVWGEGLKRERGSCCVEAEMRCMCYPTINKY